jgi:predicted Zn-dependent protease
MGEINAEQDHYPEAIGEYKAALAKRPDAQGIHFAIGVAYWAQHQTDLAEKEFHEAWKENPNDAMTNLYLGEIAVRDQRFSDALQFLLVAQHGQPNMPQVHVLLGKCYQGRKELEKAKAEFRRPSRGTRRPPAHTCWRRSIVIYDTGASAAELAEFEHLSKLEKRNPRNKFRRTSMKGGIFRM